MKTYQLPKDKLNFVKNLFHGEIFNRTEGDNAFVKCTTRQHQVITSFGIELKQVNFQKDGK